MKTRNGFVSNSSSTSFIIAVKKSPPCTKCGRSDPDFISILKTVTEGDYSDQTHFESDDVDGIVKELKEYDYPNSGRSELIKKILAHKDNPEYKVAQIQISYHDSLYNDMLQAGIKSGNIIQLYTDE